MSISIVALLLAGAPAPPPPSPVHNAQPAGQAATANTPPPPAPAFQIEPFRFLVGHWRGKGMFFNGTPVMSSMTFELINRTTMMVRATEDAPNTYRYAALWSREKGSGESLMLLSSSLDGPALYHSAGWIGDRLVFEPRRGIETGPSSVRFTYARKDERSFELTYEFSIGGVWHLGDRQTFMKVD